MQAFVFSPAERKLLETLNALGVRVMLVGMSAAALQGATSVTDDLELWFEDLNDPRIGQAVREAGGIYLSGSFGMAPPRIGGATLGDRFDVVTHMSGLGKFADEWGNTHQLTVDGVPLRLLLLRRIIASKRAAGRIKDMAQVPSLEAALAAIEDSSRKD
jgi:hypothetical protein